MLSKKESTESEDHVQLRLRMSSGQIDEQRANDRNRSTTQTDREREKTKRLFDSIHAAPWRGTNRKESPNSKDSAYWQRAADMALGIADRKMEKKHRKYWNRKARQYEERAND